MAEVKPIPVILTGGATYIKWREVMKTKANKEDLWRYIDPDTPQDQLPKLVQPPMPVPADVKADIIITPSVTPTEDGRATPRGARIVSLTRKAKFSDLDADEKEELRLLRETWSYELKTYQRQSEAYRGLGAIIQASIDHKYLLYTFNCETP